MTGVSVQDALLGISLRHLSSRVPRTIRRSHNRFELSLHAASRYLPSVSNSTDVISPSDPGIALTHMPPIASHSLTCLSLDLYESVQFSPRLELRPTRTPIRCQYGHTPQLGYSGHDPRRCAIALLTLHPKTGGCDQSSRIPLGPDGQFHPQPPEPTHLSVGSPADAVDVAAISVQDVCAKTTIYRPDAHRSITRCARQKFTSWGDSAVPDSRLMAGENMLRGTVKCREDAQG